jgi:hypothetical protein
VPADRLTPTHSHLKDPFDTRCRFKLRQDLPTVDNATIKSVLVYTFRTTCRSETSAGRVLIVDELGVLYEPFVVYRILRSVSRVVEIALEMIVDV